MRNRNHIALLSKGAALTPLLTSSVTSFQGVATLLLRRTMVLCALTFAIITAGLERPAFANADLLSGERARLYREIKEMQWQERLSDIDTEKVVLGLRSLHQELTKEALKVVALHRSKELLPVVAEVETARQTGFMGSQVPTLIRLVAEALRQGQDPVAHLRTLLVKGELPREWLMVETSEDRSSLKDQMIGIVATDEAKRLRGGGKANADLAKAQLNTYADELLHYSKMKPEAAIDDIFNRLSHATIITPDLSVIARGSSTYIDNAPFLGNRVQFPNHPILQSLQVHLRKVLPEIQPQSAISAGRHDVSALYQTQPFFIHTIYMNGEIAKEAHSEVGPTYRGFVLRATIEDDRFTSQTFLPQQIKRPYWTTTINHYRSQVNSKWDLSKVKGTSSPIVPRGHWAYEALARLEVLGVIEAARDTDLTRSTKLLSRSQFAHTTMQTLHRIQSAAASVLPINENGEALLKAVESREATDMLDALQVEFRDEMGRLRVASDNSIVPSDAISYQYIRMELSYGAGVDSKTIEQLQRIVADFAAESLKTRQP